MTAIPREAIEAKLSALLDIVSAWTPEDRDVGHYLILHALLMGTVSLEAAIRDGIGRRN